MTRFDANGNYLWTRTFGGEGADEIREIAAGADGSVVAVGTLWGTVDLDPGPGVTLLPGQQFISKLAASGVFVWARALGGDLSIDAVAVDSVGAVYVAGMFEGSVDLDPGAGTSLHQTSGRAGYLLKLDGSGNFAWAVSVSGDSVSLWQALAVASDGSVWGVGSHDGNAALAGRSLGDRPGIFIAAFEPGGTARAVVSLGRDTLGSELPGLATGNGAVYVSAELFRSMDLDPGLGMALRHASLRERSSFVLRLDLSGAYQDAHVLKAREVRIAASPDGAGCSPWRRRLPVPGPWVFTISTPTLRLPGRSRPNPSIPTNWRRVEGASSWLARAPRQP